MKRKRSSWEIQQAVLFALLMRELKTRFGSLRLSYLWVLLEPLSHIAVFVVIFGFIMNRTLPGVNYPLFLVMGIMPFQLFSNILSRGMESVKANAPLFGYRQVKPMDAILARVILESIIQTGVFIVIILLAVWVGIDVQLSDPVLVVTAFFSLIILSYGIAISLCIMATLYPEAAKLVPMVMRPMYFVSGIFWSLSSVPTEYHVYLTWNPVLHAIELIRSAFFPGYHSSTDVNINYIVVLAILFLALGLALYRQTMDRLITT
ncbi:MAG TPA: ABC transporter permease [Gammaproteobacteria bacterium]|nr:ABC transporter permease [Gammaproteobacteria bacterium]